MYFNTGENIILSRDLKEVIFHNKNYSQLETLVFPLKDVMESQNDEINKKIQYTKSLLEKVILQENSIKN